MGVTKKMKKMMTTMKKIEWSARPATGQILEKSVCMCWDQDRKRRVIGRYPWTSILRENRASVDGKCP